MFLQVSKAFDLASVDVAKTGAVGEQRCYTPPDRDARPHFQSSVLFSITHQHSLEIVANIVSARVFRIKNYCLSIELLFVLEAGWIFSKKVSIAWGELWERFSFCGRGVAGDVT